MISEDEPAINTTYELRLMMGDLQKHKIRIVQQTGKKKHLISNDTDICTPVFLRFGQIIQLWAMA